jgi:endonuclease/exonuclease/phosphatase family metal-dependent hydrolase
VNADLIFLQEVQGEHKSKSEIHPGWPDCSHFEHLADTVWPHFAYGKNAIYEGGHHGNAILSKFPIEEWKNFNISTNKYEQRGVLHARLKIPGIKKQVDCMSLHLDLLKSGRKRQIESILKIIKENITSDGPLILGGDFNDWSQAISKEMEKNLSVKEAYKAIYGKYPRTYPSNFPILKLDRIYFRGGDVINAIVLKEWKQASDHLALFAEFKFK